MAPRMDREQARDLLIEAGRAYDPERHDPDSVFYDGSYVGPSERDLMGGCNRCGGMDDCYCDTPPNSDDPTDEGDDPSCVCGVSRSEHRMLGCAEGFQTPGDWEIERQAIRDEVHREERWSGEAR